MNASNAITVATDVQASHAAIARYDAVRARSLALAAPLSAEDACVQSMPDCSPAKWHLAHVTWFFETFILERFEAHFAPHHAAFRELFNSYYNGVGPQYPRAARGLLTRPSLDDVIAYRTAVDARMRDVLLRDAARVAPLLALGLHHEQQHQELLLMDIKHLLSMNPLCPAYRAEPRAASHAAVWLVWHGHAGGLVEVGHAGDDFCFDNETPRHRALAGAMARRWLGDGQSRAVARTAVLAPGRRHVARVHAARPRATRFDAARVPRQPLRGGRLRRVGQCTPAERVRMGSTVRGRARDGRAQ
jgi:hypothetical protein